MADYTNRRYVTFDINEKSDINYSEVYETSQDSLRLSTDTSSSFVKYEMPQPSSVTNLTTKSTEYTHSQFKTLLLTPAWSGSITPIPV